jgi:hypothetical protein
MLFMSAKSKPLRLSMLACAAVVMITPVISFAQLSGAVKPTAQITNTPQKNGLFVFPSCPIEALRAAYGSLITEADTFNVLAVEEQVLLVCRQRQELILAYKSGAEDIAGGLSDMAAQNQNLIDGHGDLELVLEQLRLAKLQLEDVQAEIKKTTTRLLENQSAETSFKQAATNEEETAEFTPNLDSCSARYSVLSIGRIKGRSYATLADEKLGVSLNAYIGEELPFGVKVESIKGTKVTVSDGNSRHVLPVANDAWNVKTNKGSETDGLVWYQADPTQNPMETTQKPVTINVFNGFETD